MSKGRPSGTAGTGAAELAELAKALARGMARHEAAERKRRTKIKPPAFDRRLWFTIGVDCRRKHFLLNENPHSSAGRMRAWCLAQGVKFYVSKGAMERVSPQARYWIQGFLCGNEPEPPRGKDGDWLPFDDPRHQRWLASASLFAETGFWHWKRWRCNRCRKQLLYAWPEPTCQACSRRRRCTPAGGTR